ncbi:MAG: MFS transporter [Nitrospirota bacterium]
MKNKRQILSWCLFDFANSTYSAVIAAVIFPVYYANVIVGNEAGAGDLWWGRAVSLSMAFVVLTSPIMGGIADYSGLRKRFLFAYTLLCIAAVAFLSFITKGMALEGFFLIVLANIGMEGGFVFYNSFLTDIAHKDYQGRVSAWGYATGYAGSILSLLMAIPLVNRGSFDLVWIMVSLLFAVFSVPAFIFLPQDKKTGLKTVHAASKGLQDAWKTFIGVWKKKEARKFLAAYLFYEDGVNTVIVFSSIFAATTLGFETKELILLYLVVQMTALTGAFVMARPIDTWGPKRVVTFALVLWTTVSVLAFFVDSKPAFWLIASIAGLGLGTVQAASRALFAEFVPKGHESEYFGVYSMVGKTSAVAGPLVFGSVSAIYGSQRPAILSIALFFIIGLTILQYVKSGGPKDLQPPPE